MRPKMQGNFNLNSALFMKNAIFFTTQCNFLCLAFKSLDSVSVWRTQRGHATTLRRLNSHKRMVNSNILPFPRCFVLFLSLNSISSIQDGLRVPKQFQMGIYQAIDSLIDNMEVLRRSCKITVNTVTLHTLYDVKILWPKNFFPQT